LTYLVSILPDVTDCGLLNHYFSVNPSQWPAARRSPITGYPVSTTGSTAGTETCVSWDAFAHTWVSPFNGFDPVVPVADLYNPVTNPTGARGSFTDGKVNVFGIDPRTGFARTVYDIVGVQYGGIDHRSSELLRQQPSRLVRDAELSLELDCRHTIRVRRHEMRRPEPHRERATSTGASPSRPLPTSGDRSRGIRRCAPGSSRMLRVRRHSQARQTPAADAARTGTPHSSSRPESSSKR
jgi:hypothetical protein